MVAGHASRGSGPKQNATPAICPYFPANDSSEAPPLTVEVDGSARSAVLRGSGWDRSDG
jgi:hypothetical protein